MNTYKEMSEIDNSPCHAGWGPKNREHNEPWEEQNEYVNSPNSRIGEPLSIPIQIRGWSSPHIQIRHPNGLNNTFNPIEKSYTKLEEETIGYGD